MLGGAVGEHLEAGKRLLQQRAGPVGHAEVGGVGPGRDLGLGEVGPTDKHFEQVEVEPAEQRDEVEALGERAAVGEVAADLGQYLGG